MRRAWLDPVDLDPATSPVRRGSLAIGMPSAPQNLDSDRIAVTRGATRFDYFADSIWTDRVPAMLRTLLVGAFETDGRIADVWTNQDDMAPGYYCKQRFTPSRLAMTVPP